MRLFYDKKILLTFDSLALSTKPRTWWELKDLLATAVEWLNKYQRWELQTKKAWSKTPADCFWEEEENCLHGSLRHNNYAVFILIFDGIFTDLKTINVILFFIFKNANILFY